MRDVVARNPFTERGDIDLKKLLVFFLASDPGVEAQQTIRDVKVDGEELRLDGRELYIYFPNGIGRSKVSTSAIERKLKVPGTGRNWNSVTKLLGMVEELGKGSRL
jgi:uncharacterized protein (DUF1697 family)